MVFIYILSLENNKYYIGKTNSTDVRINQHFNNKGSEWTKIYKPIKVVEIIKDSDDFDEDKYTLKYMSKYGIENVRGGSFCEVNLNLDTISHIEKMLLSTNNKCYICKKTGHFAKDCCEKNMKHTNIDKLTIQNKLDNIICYKCKSVGHYANQCPIYKCMYPCNYVCEKCNKIGHYSIQCELFHTTGLVDTYYRCKPIEDINLCNECIIL